LGGEYDMNIDWMSVGAKYTDGRHVEFADYFKNANWMKVPCTIGMSPAIALEEVMKKFNLPKASHITIINDCAPYGLYGIKTKFRQGIVDFFVLDVGDIITPLAAVKHF
jgi:hypothetical protein